VIDTKRWRGLRALVEAMIDQGSSAVQRVHLETARRPFSLLKLIAPVREPVAVVQTVHDGVVSGVYSAIRQVNHGVGLLVELALDVADEWPEPAPPPPAAASSEDARQDA
jgi:hypothetical protein